VCCLAFSNRLKIFAFAVGCVSFCDVLLATKANQPLCFPPPPGIPMATKGKISNEAEASWGKNCFFFKNIFHAKNVQNIFCFKHLPRLPVVFNLLSRLWCLHARTSDLLVCIVKEYKSKEHLLCFFEVNSSMIKWSVDCSSLSNSVLMIWTLADNVFCGLNTFV